MKIRSTLLVAAVVTAFAGTGLGKEQEFRLEKPDATSVELMCECKDWKAQPMTKGSDGAWTIRVSLSPGNYAYKFLVNGTEWLFDASNSSRKNVNGIENSAIDVGDTAASTASSPAVTSTPSTPRVEPTESKVAARAVTGLTVNPGDTFTLDVPLSAKRRADAAKESVPNLAHARMAIAVPQNFDPAKSWPILVICNTEESSNIDAMGQFKQAVLDEGWVIMAADAVEAEKNKEGTPRSPTIGAAFDYVTSNWPGVKDWPVACGGHSGGAKNSAFVAADLAREGHRIIGMLMSGCNQDMATVAFRKGAPAIFLSTPVFLSSGKNDKTATPANHEYVKSSLKGTGFQKVRMESFDGGHEVNPPHVGEALRWFLAQASPGSSPNKQSDFDKFFKKKS